MSDEQSEQRDLDEHTCPHCGLVFVEARERRSETYAGACPRCRVLVVAPASA